MRVRARMVATLEGPSFWPRPAWAADPMEGFIWREQKERATRPRNALSAASCIQKAKK